MLWRGGCALNSAHQVPVLVERLQIKTEIQSGNCYRYLHILGKPRPGNTRPGNIGQTRDAAGSAESGVLRTMILRPLLIGRLLRWLAKVCAPASFNPTLMA